MWGGHSPDNPPFCGHRNSSDPVAYTETDLARVRTAIAKGERTVQFADRMVTYRSVDELLEAERHIAATVEPRTRPRISYLSSSKGLH